MKETAICLVVLLVCPFRCLVAVRWSGDGGAPGGESLLAWAGAPTVPRARRRAPVGETHADTYDAFIGHCTNG